MERSPLAVNWAGTGKPCRVTRGCERSTPRYQQCAFPVNLTALPNFRLARLTGLMPSAGLCRVLPVNGSGAGTESWVCSA